MIRPKKLFNRSNWSLEIIRQLAIYAPAFVKHGTIKKLALF